jgi:hypothetical protein
MTIVAIKIQLDQYQPMKILLLWIEYFPSNNVVYQDMGGGQNKLAFTLYNSNSVCIK